MILRKILAPSMRNKQTLLYPLVALVALSAALYQALDFSGLKKLSDRAYAVATVNGTVIPKAEYTRALEAMQSGLERPLTDDDINRALKVLIDEELIVQEALRLNLASDDRLVRKNLTQALIRSVVSLDTPINVTEFELEEFYTQEKNLFSEPLIVTVHILNTSNAGNDSDKTFSQALKTGVSFYGAGTAAGFQEQKIASKLPIGKIGDILGGKARDLILGMRQGDIAGPVESSGNDIYIWLLKKQGGQLSFTQAKSSVAAEYHRRQEEQAMDKCLNRLRKQARITK